MKKRHLVLAATLGLMVAMVIPQTVNGQSNIMYGSTRNPHMNATNPAFIPSHSRAYLSLPGANINFSSPLAYSSIFQYDTADSKTYINANNILDTLTNGEKMRFGTNVQVAGLGIDFGKVFLTVSGEAKVDMGFELPSGLVTFLNEGNYNHTGDNVLELLNGDLVNARVYGEAAVGLGIRLTDRLTVGARGKMLLGYMDISNAGSSLTIATAPDYSSLTATLDLDMNYAGVLDVTTDENGKRTFSITSYTPQNYGFNFDFGARYETDLFEISASVLDLGPGIHWTDNIRKIVSARENNSFTFTGLDVSDVMQGGSIDSSFANRLIDSLKTLTEYKFVEGGEDYWTTIPTKVNLGGMLHVSEGFSAGLLFHGEIERGVVKEGDVVKTKNTGFYSRTSLLARLNLHDWVEVVASASVLSSNDTWNWFNPGVGVTVTPFRAIQIYAFIDYISNIYIVDAKQLNVSLGLNMFFGTATKD